MTQARTLMIQGTSSSAGKSLLTAALCRIFARRGVRVAPFKAQNMSNNAAVCPDGSEIGRAQAVQAAAAGIEPHADMNPILLKPEADAHCQVVLGGRAWRSLPAREYYQHKAALWSAVTGALDRLRAGYELVIIEGAGSPVELNLKPGDLVNMAVARYADAPVLLVGDIDRGGIFAQLLGTLWLLPPDEAALVRGFIVNKFRGDLTLFADGVRLLAERGGVPVLGVVPYLERLGIPDEDSVALEEAERASGRRMGDGQATVVAGIHPGHAVLDIAVIKLPHIANFDDFDPLIHTPGVRLRYVATAAGLGHPDAVILPGTKSTVSDLGWLRRQGLEAAIIALARAGVAIVGICGGFQMLGQWVRDPLGVEVGHRAAFDTGGASARRDPSNRDTGTAEDTQRTRGLGLLPLDTVFSPDKTTHRAEARVLPAAAWLDAVVGKQILGYEIHMGQTEIAGGEGSLGACQPWLHLTRRSQQPVSVLDGAMSPDGRIWGSYLHGLFENDALREAWLGSLGSRAEAPATASAADHRPGSGAINAAAQRQLAFDRLADAVEAALDMALLEHIIQGKDR
jgi:adenosylcobyric acid synthase